MEERESYFLEKTLEELFILKINFPNDGIIL